MTTTLEVAGQNRILNVLPDPPDIRDRMYEPALAALPAERLAPTRSSILDQGQEGACTGFGLAAVINQLLREQSRSEGPVSARMLYEMAKRHDEWPGHEYDGSSCRGAIRGWKNMGVCSARSWPHHSDSPSGNLTVQRAMEARSVTLGAYYRLRPEVTDYHAAMNAVGAVYCSAQVHAGWDAPEIVGRGGKRHAVIRPNSEVLGGHAFAIVGYNSEGFWVQNSWGRPWGVNGVALWTYEDWLENTTDGWVVQLALPTPQIFGRLAAARRSPAGDVSNPDEREESFTRPAPKRIDIAGHFVHFDDGRFKEQGNYWSNLDDVDQTAKRLSESDGYDQLLIYVHGGLTDPKASARRIRTLKNGFKRNRVYPYHIMYDTGLIEEIQDVVRRGHDATEGRSGGFSDWTDSLVESAVRKPGTALWEEMKRGARLPFEDGGDGISSIGAFVNRLAGTDKAIHMVGHSTGCIVLGHLLSGLERAQHGLRVRSLTMWAPACRVEFFREKFMPFLNGSASHISIDKLFVCNLTDQLEQDDTVTFAYRKSLLYMVSRAFEREPDVPLLGMERYSKRLHRTARTHFQYSDGKTGRHTRSVDHGGFDNDLTTLNALLRRVAGSRVAAFTEDEMKGY